MFLGLILFSIGIRYCHNQPVPTVGSKFIMGSGAIIVGISLELTFENMMMAITQHRGISVLVSILMSIMLSVGLIKLGLWGKLGRYIGQLINNKTFLWMYFGSIIGLMALFSFCYLSTR
jgi:small-conductance mechanosensitive channel